MTTEPAKLPVVSINLCGCEGGVFADILRVCSLGRPAHAGRVPLLNALIKHDIHATRVDLALLVTMWADSHQLHVTGGDGRPYTFTTRRGACASRRSA